METPVAPPGHRWCRHCWEVHPNAAFGTQGRPTECLASTPPDREMPVMQGKRKADNPAKPGRDIGHSCRIIGCALPVAVANNKRVDVCADHTRVAVWAWHDGVRRPAVDAAPLRPGWYVARFCQQGGHISPCPHFDTKDGGDFKSSCRVCLDKHNRKRRRRRAARNGGDRGGGDDDAPGSGSSGRRDTPPPRRFKRSRASAAFDSDVDLVPAGGGAGLVDAGILVAAAPPVEWHGAPPPKRRAAMKAELAFKRMHEEEDEEEEDEQSEVADNVDDGVGSDGAASDGDHDDDVPTPGPAMLHFSAAAQLSPRTMEKMVPDLHLHFVFGLGDADMVAAVEAADHLLNGDWDAPSPPLSARLVPGSWIANAQACEGMLVGGAAAAEEGLMV